MPMIHRTRTQDFMHWLARTFPHHLHNTDDYRWDALISFELIHGRPFSPNWEHWPELKDLQYQWALVPGPKTTRTKSKIEGPFSTGRGQQPIMINETKYFVRNGKLNVSTCSLRKENALILLGSYVIFMIDDNMIKWTNVIFLYTRF